MTPTIIALMTKVLDHVFGGDSWATWRAVLKAAFGLPISKGELETYRALTERQHSPTKAVHELWLLCGRRSGKSIIGAAIAVYLTCVRQYTVAPRTYGR